MWKGEFKSLLKNPLLLLVLIVIMFIPTIYATPFLASMWDPYGEISKLPVAVVNEDQSVIYNDEVLKVGMNLVDNLKDNDSLCFNFVDADTAEQGLKNGTYYMIITIPRDFSANAATVLDKNPENLHLYYKTNPGTNYIASKLSGSAAEKIRTSVSKEVTKTYTEEVFNGFDDITDGMDDAVDGTDDMLEGEDKLIDGNDKITENLVTLAEGGFTLLDGAKTLQSGVSTYTAGVATVDQGVSKIGRGVAVFGSTVDKGTKKLQAGASTLESGLQTYTSGVETAQSGAATLASNNAALNGGVLTMSQGVDKLVSGGNKLQAGLEQMSDTVGSSLAEAKDKAPAIKQLEDLSSLEGGVNQFGNKLSELNSSLSGGSSVSGTSDLSGAISGGKNALGEIEGHAAELSEAIGALKSADNLTEEQKKTLENMSSDVSAIQNGAGALEQVLGGINSAVSGAMGEAQSSLGKIRDAVSSLNSAYGQLQPNILKVTGGAETLAGSAEEMIGGLDTLKNTVEEQFIPGAKELNKGLVQVQTGLEDENSGLQISLKNYTAGVDTLSAGLTTLSDNNEQLNTGATALSSGIGTLKTGIDDGVDTLGDGVTKLQEGTSELVSNNSKLNSGTAALTDGAEKISDGAKKLGDGSEELGDGLGDLKDGTKELQDGLADGADEVKENKAGDDSIEMMSDPVDLEEEQETTVQDNGHAMAAYMMSVALWVGALAFCLMYPLTKYHGELKSGISWWLSKAAVLYPLAIGMALFMLAILHGVCGFNPAQWKNTIIMACSAALAFMAIMYFFNALVGKVGSFLMLVFMVVQLSGSAGTYPIEISGGFVKTINPYLPFTYTVNGFRSTIAGGQDISNCITVMLVLAVIFSVLSMLLFVYRAKRIKNGNRTLYDFIEEKGFA